MSEFYAVLCVVFSIWVFLDARTRKNRSLGWSLLTFILGPFIALPLYFAYRHLKAGEVRVGGTVWHIIRNYTLCWTALIPMIIFAIASLGTPAELVAAAIFACLFITLIMMALGLFVRQSDVVERGPSGLESP